MPCNSLSLLETSTGIEPRIRKLAMSPLKNELELDREHDQKQESRLGSARGTQLDPLTPCRQARAQPLPRRQSIGGQGQRSSDSGIFRDRAQVRLDQKNLPLRNIRLLNKKIPNLSGPFLSQQSHLTVFNLE